MNRILFFLFYLITLTANGQHSILAKIETSKEVRIVVFLSLDCPISQKYMPLLKNIYDRYGEQATLHAIVPGKIRKKALKTFIQEYAVEFPVHRDKKYKWVKELDAVVTPEVFVFDRKNVLQYRGAIDNWFYDLGQYRNETTENYLIDCIQNLLAGKAPEIEKTEPIGCIIQAPL